LIALAIEAILVIAITRLPKPQPPVPAATVQIRVLQPAPTPVAPKPPPVPPPPLPKPPPVPVPPTPIAPPLPTPPPPQPHPPTTHRVIRPVTHPPPPPPQPIPPVPTPPAPVAAAPPAPPVINESAMSHYIGQVRGIVLSNLQVPEQLIQAGLEGDCVLQFTLAPDGSILSVSVITPSGLRAVNEAALNALRSSHFPAFLPGMPTGPHTFILPVHESGQDDQ